MPYFKLCCKQRAFHFKMPSRSLILLALVLTAQLLQVSCELKVISFNARNLSERKFKKQHLVDAILHIIKDYDLILLLEVEDHNHTVVNGLVQQLNSISDGNFAGIESQPLRRPHRTHRMGRAEEYTFLYRTQKVNILDKFQYQNKTKRIFSRPPFPILVQAVETDLTFFVVPIHTQPRNSHAPHRVTEHEINALPDVFDTAAARFKTSAGVILGDLNCGCSSISKSVYQTLRLVNDPRFHWWITNDMQTSSVNKKVCAYDRIITHKDLTGRVVPGSARVIHFDKELGLDYNETKQVSDHYPVTFTLK